MRRRGFLLLDLALALAGCAMIYLAVSGGLFSGLGWSESQKATIRRLGVRGSPTLVVFYADW